MGVLQWLCYYRCCYFVAITITIITTTTLAVVCRDVHRDASGAPGERGVL